MNLLPTPAEIRAAQEASLKAVEDQLAAGPDPVLVLGRAISRDAAWAATQSIRKAWDLGGRADGQYLAGVGPDAEWIARVELDGKIEHVSLGAFPG